MGRRTFHFLPTGIQSGRLLHYHRGADVASLLSEILLGKAGRATLIDRICLDFLGRNRKNAGGIIKTKTHLCVWHAIDPKVDGMFFGIGKGEVKRETSVNYGSATIQL